MYTEEQSKDIQSRKEEALKYIQELQLSVRAQVAKVPLTTNDGDVIFADKITPVFQDEKYVLEGDTYKEKDEPTQPTQESVEAK